MRWHGLNAKYATVLVLLHPLTMFSTYIARGVSPWRIPSYYDQTGLLLGYVMIIALLTIVVTALFTNKLNLSYETWRKIHLLVYVVVFGGFIHSFLIGGSVQSGLFQVWWLGLLTIALTGFLHRYMILPRKRQLYTVESVLPQNAVAHTITLSPKQGNRIPYNAGQFAYTHFFSKAVPTEEHHFTLSSAPGEDKLQFTIKKLGDFTSEIGNVKKGEVIQLEGPYGVFTNTGMDGPFLFIAGGIGITPIRSMLKEMLITQNNQQSILLYTANNRDEMVFYDELSKMGKETWLDVTFFERRLETNDIRKVLSKIGSDTKVFVCGPIPMMKAAERMLMELDVPKKNVFTEKFALK
jgi:predicted ferric reductase